MLDSSSLLHVEGEGSTVTTHSYRSQDGLPFGWQLSQMQLETLDPFHVACPRPLEIPHIMEARFQ